jgi:trehalose synthase
MKDQFITPTIEDYEQFIGAEALARILKKAKPLRDCHIANVNSTYYGGGVAEMLSSSTLLMNSLGIKTGWRVLQGSPEFFTITKKMHNALQGDHINLSKRKLRVYEDIVYENSIRNHLEHDVVVVHDPQPLAMIEHYRKRGPWIWRCHIDISRPNKSLWKYLSSYINKYDAVILTLKEYAQRLSVPQIPIMPAINPFSVKNKELTEDEIDEWLAHCNIPTDLPLVVQVSRFDKWKDPEGVIKAFRIARERVPCTLVLLGSIATDDPEGIKVYESLLAYRDERIIILSRQDSVLVNALQRRAAVVLQKSLREGFGLTVSEAMWKGAAVIGGNVSGIRHQIQNGVTGFLVSSLEEAADRIILLLKNKKLRKTMGKKAKERVKKDFLLTRLVEQELDLLNSFEYTYRLAHK